MNILFNASQCGLSNNGGSKTIIRCAETLQDMGYNVGIWAQVNKYTWHKPSIEVIKDCPYIDSKGRAIPWHKEIVVSVWEIEELFDYNDYLGHFVWYMRGWEQWVKGEEWLIQQIKKFVDAGGRIIVNSSWLIDQLKEKCGVDSVLCWAGLDLDFWKKKYTWDFPAIGSLGDCKHKSKRDDLSYRLAGASGAKWLCANGRLTEIEMRLLYNECKIWFAPTELEGFHQCPAEANLCGCLVVCNRMPSNGMGDYATDETAMRYNTWEELIECIENPDFSKVPKMQKVLREKIGSREDNMKIFVEILRGQ